MKQSMEVTGTKFKYQETTKQIKMQFFKPDGTSYYPNPDHDFQAKVANATGMVGTYPVIVQGSNIILSTSKLTELPPDDYQMEVWETYTDDAGPETTIYPSPDACVYFTIEENIDGKSGTVIKQLGFQDVVNQAVEQAGLNLVVTVQSGDPGTQATVNQTYANGKNTINFVIPKGDKGDKGDPAVPAIIGGRNYILNSGNIVASQSNGLTKPFSLSQNLSNFNGQQITLSVQVDVDNAQPDSAGRNRIGIEFDYTNSTSGKTTYVGAWKNLSTGGSFHGRVSVTAVIDPQAVLGGAHHLYIQTGATNATASFPKFEIGSVATDWSPNPSEILTQSDYAKIQAAIVALGGSL